MAAVIGAVPGLTGAARCEFSDAFGATSFATISALIGVALTLAKTIGPVSAGVLRTLTGSYTLAMAVVIVACLTAAAAVSCTDAPAAPPLDAPSGQVS